MKTIESDSKSVVPLARRLSGPIVSLSLLLVSASCGQESAEERLPPEEQTLESAWSAAGGDGPVIMTYGDFQHRARVFYEGAYTGDFDGDGDSDVIVAEPCRSQNTCTIWTGFSDGAGNISVVRTLHTGIGQPYVGDFDGDGKDDLFGFHEYFNEPVGQPKAFLAHSDGAGHYPRHTSDIDSGLGSALIALFRASPRRIVCDINGDDNDDIVLLNLPNSDAIVVAYSNGDDTFRYTDEPSADFQNWISEPDAKFACDDFNGDGYDDLIVMGVTGWNTVPVALSNGDGTFTVSSVINSTLGDWADDAHAQVVTGDINGDDRADLILTGGVGWPNVRLGLSNGNGTFTTAVSATYALHQWAAEPQAMARGGDFNGDGTADFTLLGGSDYWYTLPIGMSNGNNTFTTVNQTVPAAP